MQLPKMEIKHPMKKNHVPQKIANQKRQNNHTRHWDRQTFRD